jgi:hypothetical protein
MVVLCAAALGVVVGIGAESPSGAAHTCMKIITFTPPTTIIVGDAPCDVEHHVSCSQQPLNGGTLVICTGT